MTRAAFTVAMAQASDLAPRTEAPQAFRDLPPSGPSYGYVMAASAAGWISGFPDGSFRPYAPMTREAAAKWEVMALGLTAQASALASTPPTYRDLGLIGRWAWGYLDVAARTGLLRGATGDRFEPQAPFSQSEFLHAMAQLRAYIATAPAPALTTTPVAAPGPLAGTSVVTAAPNATADSLFVLTARSPIATPTRLSPLPQGATPYLAGQSLAAAPGDYVGVYEQAPSHRLAAFAQVRLLPADVTGPPAGLALAGPLSGAAASQAGIGPFRVTLVDGHGNPTPAPAGGISVLLASNSTGSHLFAASLNGPSDSAVSIPAGTTSATFFYGDETAGQPVLLAASQGLGQATFSVAVTGAAPSALGLSGPAQGYTAAAALSGPFRVQLLDAFGNQATAPPGGVTVSLAASPVGSASFSLSPGGPQVASVTIPAGQAGASFFYGQATASPGLLEAQAAGLSGASLPFTAQTAVASALRLAGPLSGTAALGQSIGPFTVTLTDGQGRVVPAPPGGILVSLASTAAGTHAFLLRGSDLASLLIPAGGSQASFYYRQQDPGVTVLSAAAAGLSPATRRLAVATAVPLAGPGLDSQTVPADATQVQQWHSQGMRNIFLNTFAPTFLQEYAASLGVLNVVLFQGYWTPAFEFERGDLRAQSAIAAARAAGYPKGADIFVDVESTGSASPAHLIGWLNAWSLAVERAGYGPGVYFGVPQPLTARQAGHLVAQRFWKSYSATSITPVPRGVCVVQTHIYRDMDTDWLGTDRLGERCIGAGA